MQHKRNRIQFLSIPFACAALAVIAGGASLHESNNNGSALAASNGNEASSANMASISASPENFKLAVEYSASKRGTSTLVLQNGKILYEDYQRGSSKDDAFNLASGTKSFAGVAALAAQEDGLLDINEKVSKTITEWAKDPVRKDITIYQLLHLVAGVQGKLGVPPTYHDSINTAIIAKPGTKFMYGPASFQIFGELLRRKLNNGETITDYLQRRIFNPIGLEVGGWTKGKDNMPFVPQGASLTARNWAKFGELVRQEGRYNGKQILSPDSIRLLTQSTAANPMYGLTWWLSKPIKPELRQSIMTLRNSSDLAYGAPGTPEGLFMAAGAGGQRLYIVPSLNMVVVRQAVFNKGSIMSGMTNRFSDTEFLQRLFLGQASASPGKDSQRAAGGGFAKLFGGGNNSGQRDAMRKRFLEKMDTNGDGTIDQGERGKIRDLIRARMGQNSQ